MEALWMHLVGPIMAIMDGGASDGYDWMGVDNAEVSICLTIRGLIAGGWAPVNSLSFSWLERFHQRGGITSLAGGVSVCRVVDDLDVRDKLDIRSREESIYPVSISQWLRFLDLFFFFFYFVLSMMWTCEANWTWEAGENRFIRCSYCNGSMLRSPLFFFFFPCLLLFCCTLLYSAMLGTFAIRGK